MLFLRVEGAERNEEGRGVTGRLVPGMHINMSQLTQSQRALESSALTGKHDFSMSKPQS